MQLTLPNELNELNHILASETITTLYQPIVLLSTGEVLGYEALTRGPIDSSLYHPSDLFTVAETYQKTWELELLCRIKAIQNAKDLPNKKLLFLNVDPLILKDKNFSKGFTKEFLLEHHMSLESIVFELTEKSCVTDYHTFNAALDHYRAQGYQIAIDDMGSGYSGLKLLTHSKPHYIKIDMDLIRHIHTDQFKQSLIECFVKLAHATHMQLIAEGIESEEELKTLMYLGVHAGQGFLLGRPSCSFEPTSPMALSLIHNHHKNQQHPNTPYGMNPIGELALDYLAFEKNTECGRIKSYFENHPEVTGACILANQSPVGLIMKNNLDAVFAKLYGVSIFTHRPVSLIVDQEALVVDYYTPVREVSKLAMSRPSPCMYDYIIVTKNQLYYGMVTIKSLLDFTSSLEYNYARQLNPLTGLPGNATIESILTYALHTTYDYCILYFDLDHFKIFNDLYGFEKGDCVIKHTAHLIRTHLEALEVTNGFIGHIGGDDFIGLFTGTLEQAETFCTKLLRHFDESILTFFSSEHRESQTLEGQDRLGHACIFPLTSLSIGGIYGPIYTLKTYEAISLKMATLKKEAKNHEGSHFTLHVL